MNLESLIPDRILWSPGVQDFSYTTIDLVRELGGAHREWDCDMITLRGDENRITRRLIPSAKSYVTSASVHVSGLAIMQNTDVKLKAMRRQEDLDLVMSGILHSHGSIGAYFSGTDFDDFEKEGPKIAANNRVYEGWLPFDFFEEPTSLVSSNGHVITQSNSTFDPRFQECPPTDETLTELIRNQGLTISGEVNASVLYRQILEKTEREYQEFVQIGIAQAIVVDATKSNPFGIIGYHILKPLSGEPAGIWKTKKVPVEIMAVDRDMTFNRDELRETLGNSLHIDQPMPPMSLRQLPKSPTSAGYGFQAAPSKSKAQYADEVYRQAHQFTSGIQSYVTRFSSRQRLYPSYLASIANELPHNFIGSTVSRLGPLQREASNGEIIDIKYSETIHPLCRLLTRECKERDFIRKFGGVVSLKTQNGYLESYVKSVLDQNGNTK